MVQAALGRSRGGFLTLPGTLPPSVDVLRNTPAPQPRSAPELPPSLTPRLRRLWLEHVAWSAKPRGGLALTVFTQLSVDRLSSLEAQCASFEGPLSAAVYISLVQVVARAG